RRRSRPGGARCWTPPCAAGRHPPEPQALCSGAGPARGLHTSERGIQMAKKPQVGEQAPDFELQGTDGPFKLSDHRGERVVLLFYPGDNTMVCTKQFCSYRDRPEAFAALGATVVGISAQDVDSHEQFTEKHKLNVPLLADRGGEVAKLFSAWGGPL